MECLVSYKLERRIIVSCREDFVTLGVEASNVRDAVDKRFWACKDLQRPKGVWDALLDPSVKDPLKEKQIVLGIEGINSKEELQQMVRKLLLDFDEEPKIESNLKIGYLKKEVSSDPCAMQL